MMKNVVKEPWRGIPPKLADAIEAEIPEATEELLTTIAREVPEYARPLEGTFGKNLRLGVVEALRQFVELLRDPDSGRPGREVYVGLGRGEFREGRTLDALQSAYRVGARVAWRRVSAAARRRGASGEELASLAEAIFAYIDELSADSVEGYAQAQREREGERQARRRELLALLLRDPLADDADIRTAAHAAGWRLPRSAAPLAVDEADLGRVGRGLSADALVAAVDGTGCALLPGSVGASRLAEIERATAGRVAALGPSGPRSELPSAWAIARAALRAADVGAIRSGGLIRAEDHLADLILFEGAGLATRLADQRLAPLAELTPRARARMEETALAFVQHGGNAAAMARALHLHPQTIRYRLARLRELLGDALTDPDSRFELELALRSRRTG
jgi:PucR C-terminal helix-turn-helix domain